MRLSKSSGNALSAQATGLCSVHDLTGSTRIEQVFVRLRQADFCYCGKVRLMVFRQAEISAVTSENDVIPT